MCQQAKMAFLKLFWVILLLSFGRLIEVARLDVVLDHQGKTVGDGWRDFVFAGNPSPGGAISDTEETSGTDLCEAEALDGGCVLGGGHSFFSCCFAAAMASALRFASFSECGKVRTSIPSLSA